MPNQGDKTARRYLEVDILQDKLIVAVGKRDMIKRYGSTFQRTFIIAIGLTRPVHQLKHTLTRDYRLLQHRLLRSEFNQRFVKTAKVTDKRVQHSHLNGSTRRQAKQHQHPAQHQRREEAQQRA